MKKLGFTLAEVLITLTIIGVIASLTLPALMNNTQEQQARAALKKGINTLTTLASYLDSQEGLNYSSLAVTNGRGTLADSPDADSLSLVGAFKKYAAYDYKFTEKYKDDAAFGGANNFAIFLKDGSAFIIPEQDTEGTGWADDPDGDTTGFSILYDINGAKGPNRWSNCNVSSTGIVGADGGDITACNTKSQRYLFDRFSLRLKGKIAVPTGAMSNWLLLK